MRFSVLASGSRGNACYVETGRARVLVDAGLSCREIMDRLETVGVDPGDLDALVITHEHADHIKGAGALARRLNLPVYINTPTLQRAMRNLGNLPRPMPVRTGQTIVVHDLFIETFTKSHDAADPMGLVISSEGARLGLLTDTGRSTALVEDRLRGCHALILEFNHDETMLENGPYPLDLKRRVRGPDGHLSNRQASGLLRAVSHKGLDLVVLAHLSQVNNRPEVAYRAGKDVLARCGLRSTRILVSEQDHPVPRVDVVSGRDPA